MTRVSQKNQANTPAYGATTVSFTDGTFDSTGSKGLYVGGSGHVVVTMVDGSSAKFVSVPVGPLDVATTAIASASTTASDIIALY